MQPDLLSVEEEGNQPEVAPVQETIQSESVAVASASPVMPTATEETTDPQSPRKEKKRSTLKVTWVALGLCLFLLMAAFAWVGYWAYQLSTELVTAQEQLAALQAKHDKLQSDYTALTSINEKLNADLAQSKTDLDKANAALTAAQADLGKSQDQYNNLNRRVQKARQFAEIMYAWINVEGPSDILDIDSLIDETKDSGLIKKWDDFTNNPNDDAFGVFLDYLFSEIWNQLK